MLRTQSLDALLEAASEQGGYVTRAQAVQLGVTDSDLERLLGYGDLRRVRHGVYAMRHAQREHEDEVAGWLAIERERLPWQRGEPEAVLSHDSAAARFGLGTIIPMRPTLTLRADARRHSTLDDIVVRRAPLRASDWVWHERDSIRLPVTSPARTIVDLLLDKQEPSYLVRATSEALRADLITPDELLDAARHRKSRTAALRARATALLDAAS